MSTCEIYNGKYMEESLIIIGHKENDLKKSSCITCGAGNP